VGGDQVARDDEEDVDADEAPGESLGPEVEEQHGAHGHGAQRLDVGPIALACAGR
jgi:hypothetical protein